jgi:sterol-4alpha-carboxylate 3-dehydrogenase (decarboxylating)
MRAVVIGGSGFVGKRLVEMLASEVREGASAAWPRFDAIVTVDRAPFRGALPNGVTEIRADITKPEELRRALSGAHTVFHLASVVHVGLGKSAVIDEVNVRGTENVVDACRALDVPFLVYTSSEDVVLDREPVAGGDESIAYPTKPIHDYVRTKIEGERIALSANGAALAGGGVLTTCAVRPTHVYGPDDPHAIPTALKEIAMGKMPLLIGDPRARFDVVYVDNVVHAHLLAASRLHHEETRPKVGGRAYFVGEDNAINFFDFLRPFAAVHGVTIPTRRLPRRLAFAIADLNALVHRATGLEPTFHRFHLYVIGQDFFFSDRRAREELGYAPLVSPSEGLERTKTWVKTLTLR